MRTKSLGDQVEDTAPTSLYLRTWTATRASLEQQWTRGRMKLRPQECIPSSESSNGSVDSDENVVNRPSVSTETAARSGLQRIFQTPGCGMITASL